MNDLELTLSNIDRIITEARRHDLSFAEKAGLYAAMDVIARHVDKHINDDCGGDAYAREKISKVHWHVGAALGFDVSNGNPSDQQIVGALSQHGTLRGLLRDHKVRREKQGEE